MKRTLPAFLALVLILIAASAAAATVESVQPIRIHGDLAITDYGFASYKYGDYTLYGCYLDKNEESEASGWDSYGYFTITNSGPYGQTIDSIYVRGGSKYSWYWNWKSQYIPANSSTTYYMSGYDSITGFKGNWSVDCKIDRKNYVNRYTMSN